ncbi:MAG: hypothetical protein UT48_C0003G0017 [Parcubacteria group bacterium GW2011_GWE2_39_37]|uniref:Glycosyltransferase RgtA/B/C/D-like domain-containing protein n=1 Tax=Candidatus Falkowbacteria bacterium GW2011_GWF2_39_8 TaxID=1618642 RepID=A0A0G0S9Y6_9BACT|nr:MAG: hypothetical protein UT48_C0003G0017 [Parcubacteria group bacterium GW2011_GWE2_39_37]KKR31580.1 MAG: hypothetical protein UT64_C0056G0005 [Candidatus Falkowbacteria bacterium GW2011_GWF2_39_8]
MLTTIKNFLKLHWRLLLIISAAIVFFIGTSSYNYQTQQNGFIKWSSPDETANYTFTKLYAQSGNLTINEKYNSLANNIIHPRSFLAQGDLLKPMSFLGLILVYGKIAALTSYKVIPYLTPFFGALGIIFFYFLIKQLFGKNNGLISALLLAVFPPFVYYSSRSMFHNVLFVVLLIIGLYFAVLMNKDEGPSTNEQAKNNKANCRNKFIYPALSGLFIGLAIITRTSEMLWLLPLLTILWLFNIKRTGIVKLIILICFLALSILPVIYWNQILYNAPLNTGYPEMNSSIEKLTESSSQLIKTTVSKTSELDAIKALATKIKNTIFYFGLDAYKSFKMFYYYFFHMFAWLFWSAVLGFLLFLFSYKEIKKRHLAFLAAYLVTSTVLLFYYGSWEFHDNPDPKQTTIGNSYTRYWLPIYLGAMPFASLFILKISQLLKNKFLIIGTRIAFLIVIYFISIQFVLFGSAEGLVVSAKKQKATKAEYDQVLSLTENNSVIITRYHDKLFFPERKVIMGLFDDDNMNLEYAKLTNLLPVYYYNFTFPEKDFNYLNNNKLKKANLKISIVKSITKDFSLYRLEKN